MIKEGGKAEAYHRKLDLQKAITHTSFMLNGVRYERTTFASLADGVIVCHIKASKKGTLAFEVKLDAPLNIRFRKHQQVTC